MSALSDSSFFEGICLNAKALWTLPYVPDRRKRILLFSLFVVLWVILFSVSAPLSVLEDNFCAQNFYKKSGNSLGHSEPNSNNWPRPLFLDSENRRKRCSDADETLFCSSSCFLPPCGEGSGADRAWGHRFVRTSQITVSSSAMLLHSLVLIQYLTF